MKSINLYELENEEISHGINAHLDDGEFFVNDYAYGPGDREFDASIRLDRNDTKRFFELIGITDATDEEKLKKIKELFAGNRALFAISEYCEKHELNDHYFS